MFWDRAKDSAAAYRPVAGGQQLTFEVRDGSILDLESGSLWRLDGLAIEGALRGERLEQAPDSFTMGSGSLIVPLLGGYGTAAKL